MFILQPISIFHSSRISGSLTIETLPGRNSSFTLSSCHFYLNSKSKSSRKSLSNIIFPDKERVVITAPLVLIMCTSTTSFQASSFILSDKILRGESLVKHIRL